MIEEQNFTLISNDHSEVLKVTADGEFLWRENPEEGIDRCKLTNPGIYHLLKALYEVKGPKK